MSDRLLAFANILDLAWAEPTTAPVFNFPALISPRGGFLHGTNEQAIIGPSPMKFIH
jgi:hypothetical protein